MIEIATSTNGEKNEQVNASPDFVKLILDDEAIQSVALTYQDSHHIHCEGDFNIEAAILKRIRRNAAIGISRIPGNLSAAAYQQLIDCLHQREGGRHDRAKIALQHIGGDFATTALTESDLRVWVEERFFKPISKADKHGQAILDKMVVTADHTYNLVRNIGASAYIIGILLIIISVILVFIKPNGDVSYWKGLAGGLLTIAAGYLTPFFWKPADLVKTTNLDMARLVTVFHGYMAQMRLVGLSFAHVYTETSDKTNNDCKTKKSTSIDFLDKILSETSEIISKTSGLMKTTTDKDVQTNIDKSIKGD